MSNTFQFAVQNGAKILNICDTVSQAFEMRCYRRLLNISYKDHITNEDICIKIKAAVGKDLGQTTETEVIWLHLLVFWRSINGYTVKGKKKER